MEKIYAVVNKKTGELIKKDLTQQEAWSLWQDCWMHPKGEAVNYARCECIDIFTMGKLSNMKKYIKGGKQNENKE